MMIQVCEARAGRVRLGFDAPKDVAINRAEIAAKLKREGRTFTHKR